MKRVLLLYSLLLSVGSFAQVDITKAFDFWVGTWEAIWKDPDGNLVKGENVITKTCDGKVIMEQFSDSTNHFFGNSISVYSPADSSWHQTWADNQGSYINLVGYMDGDVRVFQTNPVKVEDKVLIKRMLFYNISENSFKWDWEVSIDGGETWNLRWEILYTRKK